MSCSNKWNHLDSNLEFRFEFTDDSNANMSVIIKIIFFYVLSGFSFVWDWVFTSSLGSTFLLNGLDFNVFNIIHCGILTSSLGCHYFNAGKKDRRASLCNSPESSNKVNLIDFGDLCFNLFADPKKPIMLNDDCPIYLKCLFVELNGNDWSNKSSIIFFRKHCK